VAARQAQGFQVRVVNVEHIYDQFGFGIFDPQAIDDYLVHAANSMGTRYVLLVGGDNLDYFDNFRAGSISFIPSPYVRTGSLVAFAPADPMLADIDGDLVPDIALGRFPVRTSAELASIIDKTLLYASKGYGGTALFVSDAKESKISFASINDSISALGADWNVESISLDDPLSVAETKAQLLASFNRGVAMVTYAGHSGPNNWSMRNLLTSSDVANLSNAGRPTVVVQYGCWNAYYVAPSNGTMAHRFLLSGDRGAAAVMGATTLTSGSSDSLLAGLVTPHLASPGMTIGDAIVTAKQQIGPEAGRLDVLIGWTLLGDPALVIQP